MIPRGSGFAVESGARPYARVRLAAAGVLAAGLLSAHAALSRTPAAEGAAASGLRARVLDGESNTARQRAYYLLARKDCMALSDRTRSACLAEARMLWGQQEKR
jgi:hypothetical protein